MGRNGKTRDTELVRQTSNATLRLVVVLSISVACACVLESTTHAQNWLNGTWEGTGYQIDADETWSMVLRVSGNKFVIEYPSLECSGVWRMLDFDSRSARFKEKITVGVSECANGGHVTIERLSRRQVTFRYSYSDTREVSASAILNRKK